MATAPAAHGRLVQDSFVRKIDPQRLAGQMRSAIQLSTASSLCAMLELLAEGKLPQRGCVRQEEARLHDFLANRFGRIYGHAYPQRLAA